MTNWETTQPVFDAIETLLRFIHHSGFKVEAIKDELIERLEIVIKEKRWFEK